MSNAVRKFNPKTIRERQAAQRRAMTRPQDGKIYEPRAYWDAARIDLPNAGSAFSRNQEFTPENFYNGSSRPVTITHIVVVSLDTAYEGGVLTRDDWLRLSGLALEYRVAGAQSISRNVLPIRSLVNGACWDPQAPVDGVALADNNNYINTCRWEFDQPLQLPVDGAVEFSIGSAAVEAVGTPQEGNEIAVAVGVFETNDAGSPIFGSSDRVFEIAEVSTYQGTQAAYPFPMPGAELAGPDAAVFPSDQVFTAQEYNRQQSNAMGSPSAHGFQISTRVMNNGALNLDSALFSSPAHFLPTRARTVRAGTKEYWWRPGAPASVVCPTRTPGISHRLPVPFTLEPGDQIDVAISQITDWPIATETDNTSAAIALSFCGYTPIEY